MLSNYKRYECQCSLSKSEISAIIASVDRLDDSGAVTYCYETGEIHVTSTARYLAYELCTALKAKYQSNGLAVPRFVEEFTWRPEKWKIADRRIEFICDRFRTDDTHLNARLVSLMRTEPSPSVAYRKETLKNVRPAAEKVAVISHTSERQPITSLASRLVKPDISGFEDLWQRWKEAVKIHANNGEDVSTEILHRRLNNVCSIRRSAVERIDSMGAAYYRSDPVAFRWLVSLMVSDIDDMKKSAKDNPQLIDLRGELALLGHNMHVYINQRYGPNRTAKH